MMGGHRSHEVAGRGEAQSTSPKAWEEGMRKEGKPTLAMRLTGDGNLARAEESAHLAVHLCSNSTASKDRRSKSSAHSLT